uniref:Uncharacterized protein n=1 Tax=Amphiprion percula TaxID=161767 RepID=A0A3P8U988_AMPPE
MKSGLEKQRADKTATLCLFCLCPLQLLVQFVQNASIPLVQGLEDSESKHSCLPLLAPAESSLCSPLELTGHSVPTSAHLHLRVSDQSTLVVQAHSHQRATPSPPPILHDLQQSDSTSYVLLNLAKGRRALNWQHMSEVHTYQSQSCRI